MFLVSCFWLLFLDASLFDNYAEDFEQQQGNTHVLPTYIRNLHAFNFNPMSIYSSLLGHVQP
jgi:hypothetical protein